MSARLPHNEDLLDLLCEQAARGLDAGDMKKLRAGLDDAAVIEEMERAAAAIDLALADEGPEPLPASARAALERAADTFERGQADETKPDLRLTEPMPARRASSPRPLAALGWVAAAACLVLAVAAWWPDAPTPAPTLEQRYAQLASTPGVVRTAWAGLDDLGLSPAPHRLDHDLAGEVVWDPATQTGYMKFTGLAVNDPRELQYQLWVFDAARPTGDLPRFAIDGFPELLTQRPIDGGVFDATSEDAVIIPIDAKLFVGDAKIFAVTAEPPGGVVVSDRDIVAVGVAG